MSKQTPSKQTPLAAVLCGVAIALPALAGAQSRLVGSSRVTPGVWFDAWDFGDGVTQPSTAGGTDVRITRVTQLAVPLTAVVSLPHAWTFDVATAFATSKVTLAAADPVLGKDSYSLSGFTDTKLRFTGPIGSPNILLTLGLNVPTGKTKLSDEEIEALRVTASPALALRAPIMGAGTGGTAGVVFAREIANWGWALGVSYEARASYRPLADISGVSPELRPSNAVRVSVGGDGIVGQNGMTINVAADFFADEKFTASDATAAAADVATNRLGPIVTAEWRYRIGSPHFRDLSLYAIDRYRSSYKANGATVPQSSGNYLDAGVSSVVAAGASTGVILGANVRHQTGLKSDNTLSTAALVTAGVTLGLSQQLGRGNFAVEPVARAQFGSIKSGDASVGARELGVGISLVRKF